ncbi:glycerophosphodiester phosphodiesterase family protein [Tamlana sp. 2_MG-2023]|uniref:glycerophosphodiester phosphodiesterase n=1 Tax=unclassified Tamlana TaxID=2614803 RepID=UPI0026E3F0E0|nr:MULTISPECIES: glycerophosphodiester phosphodiesterase family protein [unclassified Tamlana]MDO6760948.1 glycerophosphodiester phosphodiesterase family protein [Tamlana sp. 2_MG-2023]MDO6791204.1 glycerophosphodiester phosphodiesterase family protein [Tamlana sp. 1_MG-2023]
MTDKVLKIGHRGAKGHLAENTLESIQKALDLKVDGIEIDVHRCASGELVVFHDFTLNRVTDGLGEVSKHTLNNLKKVKVKGRYQIATLSQVLALVDNKCLLNIELKGQDTAKEACRLITFFVDKKGWDYSNIIVSSFQFDLLEEAFKINKDIPLGVLTNTNLEEAVNFAKSINAVSIHPNYTMLTPENVEELKQDFKVIAYTVNNLKPIERMIEYGVNGIISDYPDRI